MPTTKLGARGSSSLTLTHLLSLSRPTRSRARREETPVRPAYLALGQAESAQCFSSDFTRVCTRVPEIGLAVQSCRGDSLVMRVSAGNDGRPWHIELRRDEGNDGDVIFKK